MNMIFHPDLTLATRANTICDTQRMMSSRTSTDPERRITTTKGFRNSFWNWKLDSSSRSRNFIASWRKLSMAYMATERLRMHPTVTK